MINSMITGMITSTTGRRISRMIASMINGDRPSPERYGSAAPDWWSRPTRY